MSQIEKLFVALANAFPVWVAVGAGLALWRPETALWFQPNWIPFFLGVIMLSMGLTLDFPDFLRVLQIPRRLLLGVGLQYLIMPVLGFLIARGFELPVDYAIGLALVASCPGGTASNVVCFIARTNVALSVSLTACSTLLAVVATPLLTAGLVAALSRDFSGGPVDVDTVGLLINTFKIVIVPVTAGVLLNHYFHRWIERVNSYTPLLAVLAIVFIVDFILAAKRDEILATGGSLALAVLSLHVFGFALGYGISRALKFPEGDARTVSVEVGMQNSGLATELARSNFPGFASATVPGALSALTHCILGSVVAGLCRIYPSDEPDSSRRAP